MINVAIGGSSGRMGQAIQHLVSDSDQWSYAGGTSRQEPASLLEDGFDVFIDFSTPSALAEHLQVCTKYGKPIVVGTTGLTAQEMSALRSAACDIPVFFSANMSVGIHVLKILSQKAAKWLAGEFDVDIQDIHHRNKQDAPSGTTYSLAESIAQSVGWSYPDCVSVDPSGARSNGSIALSAIRTGQVIGEHTVFFTGEHEQITLKHEAKDRSVFASGALSVGRWIVNQVPGYYTMQDVLTTRQMQKLVTEL